MALILALICTFVIGGTAYGQDPITHPGGKTTVSGPNQHGDDYAAACTELDGGQKVGVAVGPTTPYEVFNPGDTGPLGNPGNVFPVVFDGVGVAFAATSCTPEQQPDSLGNLYKNGLNSVGGSDHDLVPDDLDNCDNNANTLQQNSDPQQDVTDPSEPNLVKLSGDACDQNNAPLADPDLDDDGDPNTADNCPNTANSDQANSQQGTPLGDACDPANGTGGAPDVDADDDGVPDAADDCDGEPGPPANNGCPEDGGDPDGDGDGVPDASDNCQAVANPGQQDNDGDEQGDACDADDDNDAVDDGPDNCDFTANTGQEDNDADAEGDACDADDDNDAVDDGPDNCDFTANGGQENNDGDAEGDECDADDDNDGVIDTSDDFPFDSTESDDTDGDGVGDNGDNCLDVPNAGQEDADANGTGDACEEAGDPDGDGDGVSDATDNCPDVPNAGQEDADANGTGDACEEAGDPDGDGDGVPDATDNCPTAANAGQANNDGDAEGDLCDADDDNDGVADSADGCPLTAASTSTGCAAESGSDAGNTGDGQTDTGGGDTKTVEQRPSDDQQQTDGVNGIEGVSSEVLKATDVQAPSVTATVASKVALRRVLRRGLRVALTASEPATVRLALVVSKRTAKRLGLRNTQVAKTLTTVESKRTVKLTLTKRARRALSRLDRVTFKLRIAAMDSTGNAAGSVRAIRAR